MEALHSAMLDLVPSHAPDTAAEIVEGEVLVYDPRRTEAFYLNPTAGLIWGLCDGTRLVQEVISIVEDAYPDAGATLTNDILITLAELQQSGVLVFA